MNWIKQQIEWVKSFLSEPRKECEALKGSSKRLNVLLIVLTFVIWYGKIAWAKKEFIDIPDTWAWILVLVLGYGSYLTYLRIKNGKKE